MRLLPDNTRPPKPYNVGVFEWELLAAGSLAGIIVCIYLRQFPVSSDTDPEEGFRRIWQTWSRVGTARLAFELSFAVFTLVAVTTSPHFRIVDPIGRATMVLGVAMVLVAIVTADKVRQIRFVKLAPLAKADVEVKPDPMVGWIALGVILAGLALAFLAAHVLPTFQIKLIAALALLALSWSGANAAAYAYLSRKPSAIDRFPAIGALIERSGVKVKWVGWVPGTLFNAMALSGDRVILLGPVSNLREDEVLAIVGHELAHLKYQDVPRYQNLNRLSAGLGWSGFVGVILACGPELSFAQFLLAALAGRIGLLLGGLISSRVKKDIELRADQFAAELTSADSIASGLTKLHLRGGIADRWLPWEEPFISHPTLDGRLTRLKVG